ncbi:MAG: glycine cleavage system protein GcvH [Candidatus Eremiobacteraeota bacterium]|nr:glycine cleavage system protein GcvH [Candidatus Eremiobacteraeota bacterium]
MSEPAGFLFSKEHEWVKLDGDVATVGITEYAQNSLGDIVYVELPRVGTKVEQFASIGVIESVKAVSDLFTPIGGEIVEVNGATESDPAVVNRAPYAEGWLVKVKVSDASQQAGLLSAQAYEALIAEA